MKQNKYSINIAWSPEDNCFVATIPEFPNLSASGESSEEAIVDANLVLQMALDSLERDNIPPPAPVFAEHHEYSGQFRVRLPKSLHEDLAVSADKDGVSMNTYVVAALASRHAVKVVSESVERKIDTLFDRQNENFASLHRKLNKRGSIDPQKDLSYTQSAFFNADKDNNSQPRIVNN